MTNIINIVKLNGAVAPVRLVRSFLMWKHWKFETAKALIFF